MTCLGADYRNTIENTFCHKSSCHQQMCPFPSQPNSKWWLMTLDWVFICVSILFYNLINPGTTDLQDTFRFQLQPQSCKTATATAPSDTAICIRAWQEQEAAPGGPETTHDLYSKAFTELEGFAFLSLFPVKKPQTQQSLISLFTFYSAVVTQFEDLWAKRKKPSNIPLILVRTN